MSIQSCLLTMSIYKVFAVKLHNVVTFVLHILTSHKFIIIVNYTVIAITLAIKRKV